MEASKRFEILNKFLGWGNPENAIWFVGIEEGGGWSRNSYKLGDTSLWEQYEASVDVDIQNKYTTSDGIKHYTKEDILTWSDSLYINIKSILKDEGLANTNINNLFISNLYPLGVNSTSCEDWVKVFSDYKTIFDLKNDEYQKDKYYDRASKERFKTLNNLRERYNPLLTICYGIDKYSNFSKCFNVEVNEVKYEARGRYFVSEDNTLIIINHLSYPTNVSLFKKNHIGLIRGKYGNRIL